jgi:hypothetical protein
MNKIKLSFIKFPLDFIGLITSLFCALHCASIPLLLSFSTFSAFHFLGNPWVEYSVVIFSLVIALISFIPAYKIYHHKFLPILILGMGFIFIASGQTGLLSISEIVLTVVGAILISIAHIINWRLVMKFTQECSKMNVIKEFPVHGKRVQ